MIASVMFTIGLGLLVLLLFGILEWLHIPAGNLIDWIFGIASFWWLVVIVTIPWNIYFEAKQVIIESETSQEKGITVDNKQIEYVTLVSRWSIIIAIALHLISAIGLYILAATGISAIGYISSAAALLLTGLRPAISFYQYLEARISSIRREIKYPREDVIELQSRLIFLENNVQKISEKLDPKNDSSLVNIQQREWQQIRENTAKLRANLEGLKADNQREHQRLSEAAKNAISQLAEDSKFLGNVREIIRFIKNA
ncbi:MAG: hypothetical protein QNJ38_05180 [Prochloraceae cyanobacterium]|nr:hypothetical protein [Prochloraceae cyanobacterium]